jgi:1-deoxy-D-xylulose-5-phosphate synthase
MAWLEHIDQPHELKTLTLAQLNEVASEIRQFLIDTISSTGGHFASNLGVVELTLGLHYVFDSPKDKIIFDVGHQAYVHKILTGRKHQFGQLRQKKGLSGFTRRYESVHDHLNTGHASNSISYGLGMAVGQQLLDSKDQVIAVIGDAGLTGGLALAGINNAGHLNKKMIIVINDNNMSIGANVGAIQMYLTRCREDWQKHGQIQESVFTQLGFQYLGPVDGHDLEALVPVLRQAQKSDQPVIVHTVTTKGYGYAAASEFPDKYHGVGVFDPVAGLVKGKAVQTFTQVFSDAVLEEARKNKHIVAITAAMTDGTGLAAFAQKYPKRFFDVGISEEHAVTFASGLASAGMRPIVAIYSTFIQRAVDQVIHDVMMQGMQKVVFVLDRAGLVPADGENHQGLFDVALFRSQPQLILLSPSTATELKLMLAWGLKQKRPVMIRYPKDSVPADEPSCKQPIVMGCGVLVRQQKGSRVLLIALGTILSQTVEASDILGKKHQIVCDVYHLRFAQPIDTKNLLSLFRQYAQVFFVEEHMRHGGVGEYLADIIAINHLDIVYQHAAVDQDFLPQGSRPELLKMVGLHAAGLVKKILTMHNDARVRAVASQIIKGKRGL